jgi:hypothetical protein
VIDETGFLKQGKASCGVARQYTGSAGKITDCQIGVFCGLRLAPGHGFIDRALYLPKEWTNDPDRLEAACVPPNAGFATNPKLATPMIARAIAASVPFKWVAGDTMVLAISNSKCVAQAKAMHSGSAALMYFILGASVDQSPVRPLTSPRGSQRPTGNACRQGPEPRDRGCMIGAISN